MTMTEPYFADCWFVVGDEYCGLERDHSGPHVPFVPGYYLRPPDLHPLALIRLRFHGRCPVCSGPVARWTANHTGPERHIHVDRYGGQEVKLYGPAWEWQFGPCGCSGRQPIPRTADTYSAPAWLLSQRPQHR
ncbi:hypothetical protein ABZ883_04780 [Streptomyces sp. NPDC046977]|uniref:hypothetical protein n=1 Tax=Streptomyces sp. NPDC046977 TaxID=3154703 RepID=UPI003409CFC0